MSVILDPGVCNEAITTGRLSVGAFVGNELRGVTQPTKLSYGKGLYFLNILSNTNNEEITFKLLDEKNGTSVDLDGKILFSNGSLVGSIATPYQMHSVTNVKCEDYYDGVVGSMNLYAYPNPYNKEVYLILQGNLSDIIGIKIFDITGKLIDEFEYKNSSKSGSISIEWNAADRGRDVKSGIYFVEVMSNGNLVRTKLVKY